MTKKDAYKIVLEDLKKQTNCRDNDYCIGCYGCGLRLVYKTLKSHYDWMFNSKPVKPKKTAKSSKSVKKVS